MSFDRDLEELLDRIGRAGVSVEITAGGGLLARSNGCRVGLFVELVRELHAAQRAKPVRARELISERGTSGSPFEGSG